MNATERVLAEMNADTEYNTLKVKVQDAQAIHRMISKVYGRDCELWRLAWQEYIALGDQLNAMDEKWSARHEEALAAEALQG